MPKRRMRCAILDDYQGVSLSMADWSSLGDEVEPIAFSAHFESEDELVRASDDCEIVVAMRERTSFSESTFARLPRLALVVTTGMRNSAIDVEAANARGVVVCGTRSNSEPPTELSWALILGLARNLMHETQALRSNGPWQTRIGVGLHGKRLGLLGFGNIGTKMARVGQAFGMDISAWSQNLSSDRTSAAGVTLAPSMRALFEESDFVSIHLKLSERTRGLVRRDDLRAMRPTAYLVNTSRSAIVDGAALMEALHNRWIAGAGLDVFDVEPLPAGDAMRSLPNVLATPHIGYVTDTNYRMYYADVIDDIRAFIAGAPVRVIS